MEADNKMEKIVSLCKRRGFVFPGSEIYGGMANSWDYGPLGVELKNNIKQLWWKHFVQRRDDMVGIDAALIMNLSYISHALYSLLLKLRADFRMEGNTRYYSRSN